MFKNLNIDTLVSGNTIGFVNFKRKQKEKKLTKKQKTTTLKEIKPQKGNDTASPLGGWGMRAWLPTPFFVTIIK